jgi:uncharacterized protein YndB with AHSA1/START domain
MTDIAPQSGLQMIEVDEVFPHAPELIWRTLTTPELIGRWLKMTPEGFAAIVGTHFTMKTTPAGAWDGVIRCKVLEVIPDRRLAFAWTGGDKANVGYGSRLDTIVTWTLTPVDGGTRVHLVHSGFVLPHNESAYRNMSEGWKGVVDRIDAISGEFDS